VNLENYKPILLNEIFPNQTLDFDLYIYLEVNNKFIKYVKARDSIEETQIQRLRLRKVNELFVHLNDISKYNKYLAQSIARRMDIASDEEKARVISQGAKEILSSVNSISQDEDARTWTNNCVEITRHFIEEFTDSNLGFIYEKLSEMLSDCEKYECHSMSTSALSSIVTMALGIYDPQKITEAALGGLLHDVGLSRASEEVKDKYLNIEELSASDREVLFRHPQDGVKILSKLMMSKQVTETVRKIVAEHHERSNGSGYPKGLVATDISYLTKIVSIADVLSLRMINSEKPDFGKQVYKLLEEQETLREFDITIINSLLNAIMVSV
jgi:putative nucleotidyltransferase with HDIG domain